MLQSPPRLWLGSAQWDRVQVYLRVLEERAAALNAREAALDGRATAATCSILSVPSGL